MQNIGIIHFPCHLVLERSVFHVVDIAQHSPGQLFPRHFSWKRDKKSKNKKHTDLKRHHCFKKTEKQRPSNVKQENLYKPKLLHFYDLGRKAPFCKITSKKNLANSTTAFVTVTILISKWSSKDTLFPYFICIILAAKGLNRELGEHEHTWDR